MSPDFAKRAAPHAALLVVQLAFGSQAVEAKVLMGAVAAGGCGVSPASVAMLRMLFAAVVFQAIYRLEGPSRQRVARDDHLKILGLSVLGVSLNQGLFLAGLRLTTPFVTSLLGAAIPVATAAIAVLLRVDRMTLRKGAGLTFAVLGVLTLTGLGHVDKGAILVALNSISYAGYIVLSRPVLMRLRAVTLMAWLFTYGALLFAPVGLLPLAHTLPELTPRAWMYTAYILLVPTLLAYLLNAWALSRVTPTVVTAYIYLQPLVAAVIAWIQLGQAPEKRALLAAPLILLGVALSAFAPVREKVAARG
jgi:drug/metabolite transporter (DMT)-like permease